MFIHASPCPGGPSNVTFLAPHTYTYTNMLIKAIQSFMLGWNHCTLENKHKFHIDRIILRAKVMD